MERRNTTAILIMVVGALALAGLSTARASGPGWGLATLIESSNGNAEVPLVAADGAGNAIAVWRQTDGQRYNVYANRYGLRDGLGHSGLD